MRHILRGALVVGLAGAAGSALAQVGGLEVVVVDAEGAPLAAATVTLSHATGYVKTSSERTDAQGRVRFPVLRPGPGYRIEVAFPGFSPLRYDELRVSVNELQRVRVQMIEQVSEQVRVTAERSVVDLDKTQTSTKFTDDFIADLPVLDRFYQNVLTLAPGVQDADGDGNPNVHGARARDFQALVGEVSNVDPLTGQWYSRVNPNSIEEMEIITSGAGVEYGRAQGGFARIVQKQGSNRHEGVVEFHFQTSELDARSNSGSDAGVPEFETWQPGFQFSGPVVRDKLWYRASYERREVETPVNVANGIDIYTVDSETRDALLTWQVSPRNKLALGYRSDPVDEENFGISSRVRAESAQNRSRDVETWSLVWTAPYSPKILAETTVAWQDVNLSLGPAQPGQRNDCVPDSVIGFLGTALCDDLTNGRLSGSYNENNADNRQRLTFKTKATVYGGRFWGAEHQLKFGFNVENERYFRELRRTPSISFEIVYPVFSGNPFGVILAEADVPLDDEVRATGTNWALYAEDQLRPASNVTITLGARVDREELNSDGRAPIDLLGELAGYEQTLSFNPDLPVNVFWEFPPPVEWPNYFTGFESMLEFREQIAQVLCAGQPPELVLNCKTLVSQEVLTQLNEQTVTKRQARGLNVRNTNVSPFLALAWDPTRDGKTAVKCAAGRHYNNVPLVVPLQELEPVRTSVEYRANLDTFQTTIFNGVAPSISVYTVDEDLETPYQDEFTVGVERELWRETSINLTYVNRRFRDQLQDRNVNVITADYGTCASPGAQVAYNANVFPVSLASYGDGITPDDCGGITMFFPGTDPFGADAQRFQLPDGRADLYVLNPFWGGINEIGNYNSVDYEAWVVELVRRQYRGWEMNGSYTYSTAEGDGEDFLQELANDPSLRDNVFGAQSYDQRHVAKLNATTITPWGLRLGTAVSWQSGLPYSILAQDTSDDILPPSTSFFAAPGARLRQSYPTGERNDQRNRSYWNIDAKVTKELRLERDMHLQLSAEVFNVLDDDTYLIYNPFFEAGQQLNGENEAIRRFGRRWQLGAKLSF
jgi:hypothetical protein